MGAGVKAAEWTELAPWWRTYLESRGSSHVDVVHPSEVARLDRQWPEIDTWWGSHLEEREARTAELRSQLERLDEVWRRSESRFDRDPLGLASGTPSPDSVTLRPNREENWSHWLAHLLRSSSGQFVAELLGGSFDSTPRSVRREAYLPEANGIDRRADIVLEYPNRGVTIEVKKGDEHYEKTPHTAALAERGDRRSWTHVLLIPERKEAAVGAAFGEAYSREAERPVVHSSVSADIDVLFWKDVSRALRRTLLEGEHSDHVWEASGYLFVATIEQSIVGFERVSLPNSADEDPSEPDGKRTSILGSGDLSEQLAYVEQIVESTNHE